MIFGSLRQRPWRTPHWPSGLPRPGPGKRQRTTAPAPPRLAAASSARTCPCGRALPPTLEHRPRHRRGGRPRCLVHGGDRPARPARSLVRSGGLAPSAPGGLVCTGVRRTPPPTPRRPPRRPPKRPPKLPRPGERRRPAARPAARPSPAVSPPEASSATMAAADPEASSSAAIPVPVQAVSSQEATTRDSPRPPCPTSGLDHSDISLRPCLAANTEVSSTTAALWLCLLPSPPRQRPRGRHQASSPEAVPLPWSPAASSTPTSAATVPCGCRPRLSPAAGPESSTTAATPAAVRPVSSGEATSRVAGCPPPSRGLASQGLFCSNAPPFYPPPPRSRQQRDVPRGRPLQLALRPRPRRLPQWLSVLPPPGSAGATNHDRPHPPLPLRGLVRHDMPPRPWLAAVPRSRASQPTLRPRGLFRAEHAPAPPPSRADDVPAPSTAATVPRDAARAPRSPRRQRRVPTSTTATGPGPRAVPRRRRGHRRAVWRRRRQNASYPPASAVLQARPGADASATARKTRQATNLDAVRLQAPQVRSLCLVCFVWRCGLRASKKRRAPHQRTASTNKTVILPTNFR